MFRLNPFQRYDIDGLGQYLHDQAMNGYHIKYVSGLFLWFKKGLAKTAYYSVVPRPYTIEKTEAKQITSSVDYMVYETKEASIAKTNKITPKLPSYLLVGLLITMGLFIKGELIANRFFLFLICGSLTIIGVSCLFKYLHKNLAFKVKPIYLYSVATLLLICISLLCFGISYISLAFLLGTFFFLFIPIKEIAFWTFFVCLCIGIGLWFQPPLDNRESLNNYFTFDASRGYTQWDETGLARYEDFSGGTNEAEEWHDFNYLYVRVNFAWLQGWVRQGMMVGEFTRGVEFSLQDEVELPGFKKACIKYNESKKAYYYYFETQQQILIVKSQLEKADIIGFAKEKMRIEVEKP